MSMPLIFLCLQTLFFWFLVFFLHQQKSRYTLIPLYCYIAVLTLLTHNLSDLNFAIVVDQFYFLISSFSFFTTLMLGVLVLYLFEGPRAARLALITILFTSFFYIGVIFLINQQIVDANWVVITFASLKYYFWSILAIVIDIFFITISWELLEKIKLIPRNLRIFLVIFGTYFLDALIFVTGVYLGQSVYLSILQGGVIIRLVLALISTPIASYYLERQGYIESKRDKPLNYWEILNFRSDLESKIQSLEANFIQESNLKKQLEESKETYSLAIEGANAGIWDWDIVNNKINWSSKCCSLLGYDPGEMGGTLESFKLLIHPDDLAHTFLLLDEAFKLKKLYSTEYRLKNNNGKYKWYLCGGKTKYNSSGKPIRMVGSIIDIDEKKQLSKINEQKVVALEKLNKFMVGRELQMITLKNKISQLEKKVKST